MRLVSIASGSSGNCTYIGSDKTHILIDAGVSCRKIAQSLGQLDIKPEELTGIFITHEHSDHIRGLRVFTNKYHVPVYTTAKTAEALVSMNAVDDESFISCIKADMENVFGDLCVKAFHNTHDAAEPVGYRVSCGNKSCAVATDLGNFTDYTVDNLRGLDCILMEANHDVRMLETGSYPYYLKRRILSDFGHLSNERCANLLENIIHDDLKHVLLGHLSKENNYPSLALLTVKTDLNQSDCGYKAEDFDIEVAKRDCITRSLEF